MIRHLKIVDDKLVETDAQHAQVAVYIAPDDPDRRQLIEQYKLDDHTLNSALDPDELSRMEFEPDHVAMIFKRPKHYSAADNFLFKVSSTGVFLFKDRLLVVLSEDAPLFEGRPFVKVSSLQDIVLKLLFRSIYHFEQHLKLINVLCTELESEVNTAMENRQLLSLFTLEKSLTYYLNAATCNAKLIDKLRANAAKLGFTPENLEYLDDITIENSQCYEQAQIYSNILASLMDARASIIANNLNVRMKTLNIVMIALMLPTLVVSVFSMNVRLPMPPGHWLPFWVILLLAVCSAAAVAWMSRARKTRLGG